MSNKLYADIKALQDKCEEYFKQAQVIGPRSFRVYIGLSKYTLSTWKKTQPEYFNLIKTYEDSILAKIEEYAIYGATHPDLKKKANSITYDKDGNVVKKEVKFNQVGSIFVLRAYDRDLYVPEQHIEEKEMREPIVIEMTNTSKNKINLPLKEEE